MTALLEKIFSQVSQLPDAEQEAVAAHLLHTLQEFTQDKSRSGTKPRPQFGSAKGMFWMSDDFDSPLEDFEECM